MGINLIGVDGVTVGVVLRILPPRLPLVPATCVGDRAIIQRLQTLIKTLPVPENSCAMTATAAVPGYVRRCGGCV